MPVSTHNENSGLTFLEMHIYPVGILRRCLFALIDFLNTQGRDLGAF